MVNGRPRKTQEELDREMEDYWGSRAEEKGGAVNGDRVEEKKDEVAALGVVEDDDVDMII